MSVTNDPIWPFLWIGHRPLWPKEKVIDFMTNFLVTGNLPTPRQIRRGKADLAILWPNGMVIYQNQPNPVQLFTWAEPNNSAHFMFFLSISKGYMGRANNLAHLYSWMWPIISVMVPLVRLVNVFKGPTSQNSKFVDYVLTGSNWSYKYLKNTYRMNIPNISPNILYNVSNILSDKPNCRPTVCRESDKIMVIQNRKRYEIRPK